jgi:hypothetical protein
MLSTRPLTAIATLLAAASLAGCTTNSSVCNDGVCKISLSGKGSTTTLGGEGGSNVELVSASGSSAKIKIADQELDVKTGQTISLDNGEVKVTEVKDDKIKLEVTQTSESSTEGEAAPEGETSDAEADPAAN